VSEDSRVEKFGRIVHMSVYEPLGNRLKTRMVYIKIYGTFSVKKIMGMNHKLFYGSLVNHLS
jgi:hypothetical protein